jgi:hypothetical protein
MVVFTNPWELTMKYPVGTVIRSGSNDGALDVIVQDHNFGTDWSASWHRVGEVKYDPEPLKIGNEYITRDGLGARAKIIGLWGDFVWYIYRTYDQKHYSTNHHTTHKTAFSGWYEPFAPSKED